MRIEYCYKNNIKIANIRVFLSRAEGHSINKQISISPVNILTVALKCVLLYEVAQNT